MSLLGSKQLATYATAALVGSAIFMALRAYGRSPSPGHRPIRAAGRKEMRIPPRRWDIVDEQSDESFPASDPPGNY